METERIEYLRKNGNRKKKLKAKGKKKGVLWCGIDPDNENGVIVGFSVCNNMDRFDYVNSNYVEKFGINLAKQRADKWRFHTSYFVQFGHSEDEINQFANGELNLYRILNPSPQITVEVPPSVERHLIVFLVRCKKYYKDKEFPVWCEKLLDGEPEDFEPMMFLDVAYK